VSGAQLVMPDATV